MGDDADAGLDGQLVSFLYISSLCSRIPIDTKIALILEEFPKIPSPTPFHKQRIYNLILDLLGLIPKNIGTCSKLLDVIWSDKNHAIKFLEQAKISHLFEFYTTIEAREILEHLILLANAIPSPSNEVFTAHLISLPKSSFSIELQENLPVIDQLIPQFAKSVKENLDMLFIKHPENSLRNLQRLYHTACLGNFETHNIQQQQLIADNMLTVFDYILKNYFSSRNSSDPMDIELEDDESLLLASMNERYEYLCESNGIQVMEEDGMAAVLVHLATNCSTSHLATLANVLILVTNRRNSSSLSLTHSSQIVLKLAYSKEFVSKILEFMAHIINGNNFDNLSWNFVSMSCQILTSADMDHLLTSKELEKIVVFTNRALNLYYVHQTSDEKHHSIRLWQLNQVDNAHFFSFFHMVTIYNQLYDKNEIDSELFEFLDYRESNNRTIKMILEQAILQYTPQAIPFQERYSRFTTTMQNQINPDVVFLDPEDLMRNNAPILIRRTNLVEDAMERINFEDDLVHSKRPLKVSLVNQFGKSAFPFSIFLYT